MNKSQKIETFGIFKIVLCSLFEFCLLLFGACLYTQY